MRKHILLLFLLVGTWSGIALAQGKYHDFSGKEVVRCYSMEADAALRAKHPEMGTLDEFEKWLAPKVKAYKEYSAQHNNRAVTTIPIVFHIIHNGGSDNISATYVNAQIEQLNNDFRRILGTSGYSSDSRAADTEIEFCAATVDPNGNTLSEPGINRVNRSTAGFSAPPYNDSYVENTLKPATSWDPDRYCNVWVANLSGGLLGYAQFPSNSGLGGLNSNGGSANTDGVVVTYTSVGSTGTPFPGGAPYNEGRTLTHELGHWFGLRHIWGDSNCGTDYCSDTPTAQGAASGCPTKTTCDGNLDMVENYMDYSYDDCMNIFTNDQKARIQAVMANSPRRGTLASSTVCSGGGGGGGGTTCTSTISSFPYAEGFESSLGAWTQDSGDDFDWSRNSGGTPSSGTGPTAAAAGTWYVYTEVSSPNYPSKTAILNSPCFDLSSASQATFTFQYHMTGTAVGSIELQASEEGTTSWTTVWSESGDQGASWNSASVNLSAYLGSNVKLRYNVVSASGTAWSGDIAIDDVALSTSGGGGGGGLTCGSTVTSFPWSQGFESSFGSWTQASGDDFDWSRNSGGTPSNNTGPSAASEGSTYAFMESSSPNYSTKTAILNSPCFDLSSVAAASFDFQYHMYGASAMGSLFLEATTDGTNWSAIWSESGNQGNSWESASVNMSAYLGGTVQLRFRGVTGTTWQGDMAIDDLSMGEGGGGGGCTDVTVSITFDNYPEETSWQITNSSGSVVASGGTYPSQPDGSTLNVTTCLDAGCYNFTINDSYGDGICCSYGNGSYTVSGGSSTLSGGNFGSSETQSFCVGGARMANNIAQGETAFVAEQIERVTLWPNPAKESVNLRYLTKESGAATVKVMDLMGRTLLNRNLEVNVGENEVNLALNGLAAGSYMIVINDANGSLTRRFVKSE